MKPRSKGTSTKYRLVGGKGGVGKTTLSAAWAVAAAAAGVRTLVVSTDPAPSLGDALGVKLGPAPRRVKGARGVLDAVEINPHQAFARWIESRTPALETIALRGTWLDEADVRMLLGLSLPGIDELASLLEVLRYGRSRVYDEIVVDTAPTGHTLRMLSMPDVLAGVARVFAHMQAKHHAIVAALRGALIEDEADAVIRSLQEDAVALRELLRDGRQMHVVLVTLPEELAIEEALDAVAHFRSAGIPVARMVVNRLTTPPPGACDWCRARRRVERQALSMLKARLVRESSQPAEARASQSVVVSGVNACESEPVGMRALFALSRQLDRMARLDTRRTAPSRRRLSSALPFAGDPAHLPAPGKLLMFGGKGGVGKTTCAAAAALHFARENAQLRFLLMSTDPAHSVGDALGTPVGDIPAPIPAGPRNLHVREVDAPRAFDAFRHDYRSAIDDVFTRMSRGSVNMEHDRRVLHDLLDLAPPGLDEIVAVLGAMNLLLPGTYDCLIVDTAPTGHALRLLETPATVHNWVKALMSIVLKYQSVIRVGELGAALLRLSKQLRAFRQLLENARETQFVIVTRLAALPLEETLRLQRSLSKLHLHVPAVIVNAVGAGACRRCRRTARIEKRELLRAVSSLRGPSSRMAVLAAPAVVPPPVGAATLENWLRTWRAVPAPGER